ncbi:DNA primase [Bacillus phage Mater]|uniref:DNA primase n=1 Tax=Bacillus phage Mater TaxID=1540090 RepID=A0A0A0RUP4_9CAUD|nr:DNA primase [Bacillus phage Mater]AIW03293.1 DNA primase [Bacillus phage Mater]
MFIDLMKQELGSHKTAGVHTRFCCPFCHETDYKFYVNHENGLYICFKCDARGNPAQFVMKNWNTSYSEAIDHLMAYDYDPRRAWKFDTSLSKYGEELTEEEQLLLFISRQGRPIEEDNAVTYKCPAPPTNCKTLAENFNNPEAFPFFAYLHGRGVTLEQIKQHNISYVVHGTVRKVDGGEMTLNNHLIFFTFDDKRKPLYWNTRSIDPKPFIKSFNAPSREDEYSKDNTIFNLNNANNTDKIVITEGVFDAMTVGDSGVATFGKMITAHQVEELLQKTRHNQLPIYLYLDKDAWKQMIKSAAKIKEVEPTRPVYYVFSGTDEDANELGHERVQQLISKAFPADAEGELRLSLANL